MAASVKVFDLRGGRGWSVVQGTGPHGARVKVLGIFPTRDEAVAHARKVSKNVTVFR